MSPYVKQAFLACFSLSRVPFAGCTVRFLAAVLSNLCYETENKLILIAFFTQFAAHKAATKADRYVPIAN